MVSPRPIPATTGFTPSGFTLVELAIVLMIIGLLIGGILKGQELIANARVTSTIRQFKAYDAAIITFRDSYGALPGDIANPSTRLPNCSAAQCNIAGNGDGNVASLSDESNNFWIHLAVANLISGIDTTGTWTSGNYLTFPFPSVPIGGKINIFLMNSSPSATYPQGRYGHWFYMRAISSAGVASGSGEATAKSIAQLDTKMDNGQPYTGDVHLWGCTDATAMPDGATAYVTSGSNLCRFGVKPAL